MDHARRAKKILTVIRDIAVTIPGYRAPVSASEMRSLVRHATVPPEFIEQTAVAVEATPELARLNSFDPDDARDARAFAVFCNVVADELEIVARGIRYAGLQRQASIGDAALRTFALAKTLNRVERIVPHVEIMQRTLGSKKRKKK